MMNPFTTKFDTFLIFYSIPAIYCALGCFIFYIISITEPSPYIDEIFHVGQCQQYCRGEFNGVSYTPLLVTISQSLTIKYLIIKFYISVRPKTHHTTWFICDHIIISRSCFEVLRFGMFYKHITID